jgi:transcription termination factor NusA
MLQEAMAESRSAVDVREIENMPDEWAGKLSEAGYDDLDSVINASVEDLVAIDGVDEETATQMIELARKHEEVAETEAVGEDEDGEYAEGEEEPAEGEAQEEEAKVE